MSGSIIAVAAAFTILHGCAHRDAPRVASCPAVASQVLPAGPKELQQVVLAIRLRVRDPEPDCVPGEVCVVSCAEGTVCAACEHLMIGALYALAAIDTNEAAEAAASLVLDRRLEWDAGHALSLVNAVTRMKSRVLPYLRPHVSESHLAEMIVGCIERGEPCM
jgi:hypothetical protein